MRGAVLIALTLLAPAWAQQPEEMSVDRPDFTEAPDVVPRGWLQLEGGLLAGWSRSTHSLTVPGALLRVGVARWLEIRAASDGFARQSFAGTAQHGVGDTSLEAKVRLTSERGWRPALALLPSISLPSGSPAFSSGGYDPGLNLAWSHSLPRGFDAGGNFIAAWPTSDGRHSFERDVSLSIGHHLPAGLMGFWEVYRLSPGSDGQTAQVFFDTGLSHRVGANVQLDIEAGHTLAAHTPGWFVGAGFAVRTDLKALFRKR